MDVRRIAVVVIALTAGLGACSTDETGQGSAGPATTAPAETPVEVVTSADGAVRLEIPEGALPDGTAVDDITITPAEDADLPDPPTGTTRISTTYSLEPHGLEFNEPLTLVRTLGPGPAGIEFDVEDGVPAVVTALSNTDGSEWYAPAEQTVRVEGDTVEVRSLIEHFSYAYLFGGSVAIRNTPDPAVGAVGSEVTVKVELYPLREVEVKADAEIRGLSVDDGIVGFEPEFDIEFDEPGFMKFRCTTEGTFEYTLTLAVTDDTAFPDAPIEVPLTGTVFCGDSDSTPTTDAPSGADVEVAEVEVCTYPAPFGDFLRMIQWLIVLDGPDAGDVTSASITVAGGNNDEPVTDTPKEGDGLIAVRLQVGVNGNGVYEVEDLEVTTTSGVIPLREQLLQRMANFGPIEVSDVPSCQRTFEGDIASRVF